MRRRTRQISNDEYRMGHTECRHQNRPASYIVDIKENLVRVVDIYKVAIIFSHAMSVTMDLVGNTTEIESSTVR